MLIDKSAEVIILALVVLHTAAHAPHDIKLAASKLKHWLKLDEAGACKTSAAIIFGILVALIACVACAPIVHYGIEAVEVAINQ